MDGPFIFHFISARAWKRKTGIFYHMSQLKYSSNEKSADHGNNQKTNNGLGETKHQSWYHDIYSNVQNFCSPKYQMFLDVHLFLRPLSNATCTILIEIVVK